MTGPYPLRLRASRLDGGAPTQLVLLRGLTMPCEYSAFYDSQVQFLAVSCLVRI